MTRSFTFILLLVVCFALLAAPIAAQDDTTRVRMGFFAFDPNQYDLYINGEIAPEWGSGFAHNEWMNGPIPDWEYINCCSATPYFDLAAGTYSVAFTPAGQPMSEAVLGPLDLTFEGGHTYDLAVVGTAEDGSLTILPIDETVAFAGVDPATSLRIILVNNIPGLPSVYLAGDLQTTLDFADYLTTTVPADTGVLYDVYTDDTETTPVLTVDFPAQPAPIVEFHGMVGPLPGSADMRDRFSFNHATPVELTRVDQGPVVVGEPITGELSAPMQRNRYTLTLDAPAVLNITARGLTDAQGQMSLDPALFLYDAAGNLLFWNDEDTQSDDWIEGIYDAGIDALALEAGTYFVDVASFTDLLTGPYELMVEAARLAV
jgi:hypothetical protein